MKLTTTTFTMRTCDADVLAQLLGFRLDKLIINQLAYSYIKYMTDDRSFAKRLPQTSVLGPGTV